VFPSNTVFRDGLPVALIDWDTAAPGPRAWELGWVAWRWVPFARDEKCRAIGIPTGVADKARRFRLLLDAYGVERDLDIVQQGIARARQMLGHQLEFGGRGSAWEIELARRGIFDEAELEIAWVEEHALALVES
jgi:aminoglycoside phosphotransferase (APT) family kinase protein